MLNGFLRLALFLERNSQRRMTICVRRPNHEGSPTDLDGTVEFAFLQKRIAESVTSEKVIGAHHHRLLIMTDCIVNTALLKERVAQRDLRIRIGWPHGHSPFTMEDCLVHLAFPQKCRAEIVLGIPRIRLHLQGRPVMSNAVVYLTFLEENKTKISVRHPTLGIPCQRGAPKRFNVAERPRLLPR